MREGTPQRLSASRRVHVGRAAGESTDAMAGLSAAGSAMMLSQMTRTRFHSRAALRSAALAASCHSSVSPCARARCERREGPEARPPSPSAQFASRLTNGSIWSVSRGRGRLPCAHWDAALRAQAAARARPSAGRSPGAMRRRDGLPSRRCSPGRNLVGASRQCGSHETQRNLGDAAGAEQTLRRAASDPLTRAAQLELGDLLIDEGRRADAEPVLRKIVEDYNADRHQAVTADWPLARGARGSALAQPARCQRRLQRRPSALRR